MSKLTITDSLLTGIANAIRGKNGSSDMYTPAQMATAITAIPTGGITPTGTINITENGTVDVTQYAYAAVSVSGGGGGGMDLSYLPESTAANVLASADDSMIGSDGRSVGTLKIIDATNNTGSKTAALQKTADGVVIPIDTPLFYVIDAPNTSITAYFAGKNIASGTRESFFMGVCYSFTTGNSPTFYSSNGTKAQMAVYGSYNPQIPNISLKDLHVYALTLNNATKKARFFADGVFMEEITYSNSGNSVTFGGGSQFTSGYRDTYAFKYGGVVSGTESDATVIANMQTIMTKLGMNA